MVHQNGPEQDKIDGAALVGKSIIADGKVARTGDAFALVNKVRSIDLLECGLIEAGPAKPESFIGGSARCCVSCEKSGLVQL